MKKRFTEEQIIGVLKEADAGAKPAELCRKHGISEATYYNWKAKFGGMTVSDAQRLKELELELENNKLKKLLAESMLDKAALQGSLRPKVVSPQARREAVRTLMTERGMGITRACGLVGISRSLFHYESRRTGDAALTERMKEMAAVKRRYGYRRIHVLLRREGWHSNHKRVWRLYSQAGLSVRQRKRKRIAATERVVRPAATGPNQSWSMDFVADGLAYGRRFRCLNIVDDYTRECLAIEVDTSLPGLRVTNVLERLAEMRGLPRSITVDNGPEFAGRALDAWAYQAGVTLSFIRPGKPVENAYIESFNGKFRDECLNEHWFLSLRKAKTLIENWRVEYNTDRPHSALGYLTPTQFAQAHQEKMLLTPDSMSAPY
ncbi:IS3 family transposase [Pseudomonas aeruginosa]|nr:IS3 family transposase [Pseudomonas aeruginosa]ELP3490091.1 IS3 family transposase [Pseudomonas aeruginosa]MBG4251711.1 IS3 family transposase [Pseudomonas aeruginosa]MBG4277104.1 IS3 family transposase [Pseudomonas aeruginosa]MBG6557788.1 IS3 family transposase [Pseudomonas aeruginosa]MBG6699569.1 IS3 family transposase [Pseudomonas aeruginosa]